MFATWQRGWGRARRVEPGVEVAGGLRVHCRMNSREIEFFAFDDRAETLAGLAAAALREEGITWLTVATTEPQPAVSALEAAGLTMLRQSERLMSVDLRAHPRSRVPAGYRAETTVDDGVVSVQVVAGDGSDAARGCAGVVGGYASADRILTWPDHRRRGLGSAVMGILAGAAIELGAETGLLVGGVEGQQLYRMLGWHTEATVLIAAPPGTVYPE
ncbi:MULTISPECIES: N-acetyltransferase [Catenuloplanes]|uniref:GNAT superfamily N-acetyltransferase n=1 Tax=Catenuloplanes niger TaxID=587534 RepID=A0AAE3ZVS9_9ACTN|nr:N-acetyltransferase [Catenuloplanes niger]MDR7326094.1 GNAT superfamily N-acetyltransferase [Catenuloplanes niger]